MLCRLVLCFITDRIGIRYVMPIRDLFKAIWEVALISHFH